ncbi:MAG: hypothetical protein EZS28_016926 [Streblomastix strix]|uniref:Reverse transcriptase domain-containing protein n=1 Tax=Streblomastix strix TaxID=222440 RepID=A0A5J4VY41_9EUKA|nr:MAG: hypothetical protein EZS28_016926 [Streblomastix strix]
METMQTIIPLVNKDCYLIRWDPTQAYNHMPESIEFLLYLAFRVEQNIYTNITLQFGLSIAYKIFTKVMKKNQVTESAGNEMCQCENSRLEIVYKIFGTYDFPPINESEKYGPLYTELVTKLKDLNYTGSRTNFDNV